MLPGIGGLVGRVGDVGYTKFFLKGTNSLVVPAEFTRARVSVRGAGGKSYYNNPDGYGYTGHGGGFAQSVLSVTPGETLALVYGDGTTGASTGVKRGSTFLVAATAGGNAYSGGIGQGTAGDVLYNGGQGDRDAGSGNTFSGSGAGSRGNGKIGGGAPLDTAFVQTSDGALAAAGLGSKRAANNYGSGGGIVGTTLYNGAPSVIIIEWGVGQ